MANKEKRVGLEDIARETGVSVSTVSLALREKPGIPQATRQRVLESAHLLGYHSRASSPPRINISTGKLKNIGVVIKAQPDDFPQTNQFYAHVLVGIEAACRQYQLNLIMATVLVDDFNHPVEIPSILQEGGTDGLLVVGAYLEQPLLDLLHQRSLPIVLVDAYTQDENYDSIVSDNAEGMAKMVQHLIKRGHRTLGFVGGCANAYPSLLERRHGFSRGLGFHLDCRGYFADCIIDPPEVARAVRQLLQDHPEITALVGENDEVAIATMRTAQSMGYHIPQDISVVGFDDILLSSHVQPTLTTLRVDKVSMGRLAVSSLINRSRYPESTTVTSVIHTSLVERESIADRCSVIMNPKEGVR